MFEDLQIDDPKVLYFLGVIFGSIGLGMFFSEAIGWMAAGAGFVAYGIVAGILSYLNQKIS